MKYWKRICEGNNIYQHYVYMQSHVHSHNRTKAYIFGRLCSEKETPTSGTQILAQILLYSDSVHEILQSNLLQSES